MSDPNAATCRDFLDSGQIALALRSSLLIPFAPNAVPEPGSLALAALALLTLRGAARRRRM